MSEWLAAFEADVVADTAVTKATKATKAHSENPIVSIVPSVTLPHSDEREPAPPEWVAGVRQLSALVAPDTAVPARWRQIVGDAQSFLQRWGAQAAALGWGSLDVFGVHQTAPFARYDLMGLVLLLDGAQVVAITADLAEIRTRSGARQRYWRRPCSELRQVPLWLLGSK